MRSPPWRKAWPADYPGRHPFHRSWLRPLEAAPRIHRSFAQRSVVQKHVVQSMKQGSFAFRVYNLAQTFSQRFAWRGDGRAL